MADRLRAADRWSADGTCAKLLARAHADANGELDWLLAASAATPRPPAATAIRRAAGNRGSDGVEPTGSHYSGDPVVLEPSNHAVGRSRGGLTAKVHALTDGRGRALVVLLTAGNVNDTTMFAPLLAALRVTCNGPGRPRTSPGYVVADKGYSSRANRTLLRRRGIAHTIPEPRGQQANRRRKGSAGGRPVGFDAARYARRCAVECGFDLLKQWRGLATRYDKHARNYTGTLNLAALLTWLP